VVPEHSDSNDRCGYYHRILYLFFRAVCKSCCQIQSCQHTPVSIPDLRWPRGRIFQLHEISRFVSLLGVDSASRAHPVVTFKLEGIEPFNMECIHGIFFRIRSIYAESSADFHSSVLVHVSGIFARGDGSSIGTEQTQSSEIIHTEARRRVLK
jgi:hypothetical protein